ncbi:MAG: hypothetical protein BGO51_15965 [Rhodospirillales bacterium 69-11]|nr:MAG: hypothetical protein BGO51_15965 [Rhodospirillales bacterium 69-11]
MTDFWRPTAEGVAVMVKVQPKSRRPGLQGRAAAPDCSRLRIGVTEAPEDGRATRAACAVLAGALGVPASAVSLLQGATSREKTLAVAGDPATLADRLAAL